MIQRVQSLYLFISALLFIAMFFGPLVFFWMGQETLVLWYNGLFVEYGMDVNPPEIETLPLLILQSVIPVISLVSIFLYRKRILQIRISVLNIFLMVGWMGLLAFYIYWFMKDIEAVYKLNFFAFFPLIAIIQTYLAIRAIGKDEALVRSIDRIR